MYDFKTLVDRRPMGSNKWKNMKSINPNVPDDIVPFSIADMEFKNCPEIIEGLQKFLNTAILGYSGTTDNFLNSIVTWMKKRHDWEIKRADKELNEKSMASAVAIQLDDETIITGKGSNTIRIIISNGMILYALTRKGEL